MLPGDIVGPDLLGVFAAPLIGAAFIVAMVLLMRKPTDERKSQVKAGLRACPYCAEMIRPEAVVCRYCGRDVEAVGEEEMQATRTVQRRRRRRNVDLVCLAAVLGIGAVYLAGHH